MLQHDLDTDRPVHLLAISMLYNVPARDHLRSAPEVFVNVTAHIVVPDAAVAAQWYARAFGAREKSRIPLPGGKVMSVEVQFGDAVVHIGSEFPAMGIVSPLTVGGTSTVLQLETDDADALWGRALRAGATERHPLADQFWGERHGQLVDPFGHRWNIAQRLREVPQEEIVAAAAKAFGG
jgi:PhnB protein